jgi:hypothetical protein
MTMPMSRRLLCTTVYFITITLTMAEETNNDGVDYTDHPLSGLIETAALTNRELFTAVIAAIRGGRTKQQKKQDDKKQDVSCWQHVAIKVATSAAMGESGYASVNDWVARFNELLRVDGDGVRQNDVTRPRRSTDSIDDRTTTTTPSNFGDAIKLLSTRDCHRNRLRNALDALSVSSSTIPASVKPSKLSVHQVAGLIRSCSNLIVKGVNDGINANDEGSSDKDDIVLQTRAISHLVHSMSGQSLSPCDIFLAIQLPLLQKLQWDAFINGGLSFTSEDTRADFRNLLCLKFDDSYSSAGEKRKRSSDDDRNTKNRAMPNSVHHLFLEAAHLARKGAVRAQHGAIIYIPCSSEEEDDLDGKGGTGVKIIGRGWNHDYLLDPSTSNKNKIVLHSEVHAVADAMSRFGEDECFESLFPRATIVIVELRSDYAYETCHPCPKCDPLLRAVGIGHVLHSTPHGKLAELDFKDQLLNRSNAAALLSNENVCIPLRAACRELDICCNRLPMSRALPTKTAPTPRNKK